MSETLTSVDGLDLPATVAKLAHQHPDTPAWSDLAGRSASEISVLLALDYVGSFTIPELVRAGVGSYGGIHRSCQTFVDEGLLARSDRVSPELGEAVVYHHPEDEAAAAQVMADGGQVQACPECDRSGNVHRRIGSIQGPNSRSDADYFCGHCGADFDAPTERASAYAGGGLRGIARALDEADPDQLIPDGGHPTVQVEDSSIEDVKICLPTSMREQVDTLVEVGLYASRSEAVRSAIRREMRLQAGDHDTVAHQLQHCYDRAMSGHRAETIGSLERLAEQLGVDLEREVEV